MADDRYVMQGFFVKLEPPKSGVPYVGPIESLKSTREEAVRLGSGLGIYHGMLTYDGNSYDDKGLSLIETC